MSLKKDGEKQTGWRSKQQFEGCNKERQDNDFSQGKNPTGRLEKAQKDLFDQTVQLSERQSK